MSIYPAKNKKGDFTGSWTVEVVRSGKRQRCTAPDFDQAKLMERALEGGHDAPEGAPTHKIVKPDQPVYTLGRLETEAGARLKGKKDEKQSLKRLTAMVDLLGRGKDIAAVKYADLERAAEALGAQGKGGKTVNRYLAAISGAFKWALLNEVIDKAPPEALENRGQGAHRLRS